MPPGAVSDEAMLAAFLARALSPEQWTHEAHLRIAWIFVRDYGLDEAHILFRIALVRLNEMHGVPESPARGYHETITRAWLAVMAAASRAHPAGDSLAFLERHPELLEKRYLLAHYSEERLMSVEARARFVEPDLKPIGRGMSGAGTLRA